MNTSASIQPAMTLLFGRHKDKPLAEVPNMLTDADRLGEIAGLLAAGILRLRCRAALRSESASSAEPKNLPDSSLNGLELSPETRLSGHGG
jgi:hypothetical protein